MSLSIGSESINLSEQSVIEQKDISLRFDTTKLMPIMVTPEMFEEIHLALGLGQVLEAKPKAETGKEFHKWLRESGQIAGKILYKLSTNPQLTKDGVLIKLNAQPQMKAEETPEETTEKPKEKAKGK